MKENLYAFRTTAAKEDLRDGFWFMGRAWLRNKKKYLDVDKDTFTCCILQIVFYWDV